MKSWIIKIIVIVAALALMGWQHYRIDKLKSERDKYEYNFEHASFKIDSLTTKNGEMYTRVASLVVTEKELKRENEKLYNDVESMGLKIKRLQSVVDEKHEYIVKYDTIFLTRDDTTSLQPGYRLQKRDKWIDLQAFVTLEPVPMITDFNLKLENDITTAVEFIFKRRWFLGRRRVVGTNVYTKSDNPYFKLSEKKTFMVDNKWNKKLN